jgi:hypothetical protein
MKRIAVMIATLSLVTTSWAQGDRTENGRKLMQTANDTSMVAPALQKYECEVEIMGHLDGLITRDQGGDGHDALHVI